jgi:threonylcarbamoyladenosine tRNA methylthiotransferase MtaB
MEGQVEEQVKEERSKKLIELSNKNEEKFMSRYIGKEVKVLFEQKENENIKGHTTNYILVKSVYKNGTEGKIKGVKIKKQGRLELLGEIL